MCLRRTSSQTKSSYLFSLIYLLHWFCSLFTNHIWSRSTGERLWCEFLLRELSHSKSKVWNIKFYPYVWLNKVHVFSSSLCMPLIINSAVNQKPYFVLSWEIPCLTEAVFVTLGVLYKCHCSFSPTVLNFKCFGRAIWQFKRWQMPRCLNVLQLFLTSYKILWG